jgi:hypothetical protein
MMRKRYTPTFKAQVVRDLLKEEKTPAQLAAKCSVQLTPVEGYFESSVGKSCVLQILLT